MDPSQIAQMASMQDYSAQNEQAGDLKAPIQAITPGGIFDTSIGNIVTANCLDSTQAIIGSFTTNAAGSIASSGKNTSSGPFSIPKALLGDKNDLTEEAIFNLNAWDGVLQGSMGEADPGQSFSPDPTPSMSDSESPMLGGDYR